MMVSEHDRSTVRNSLVGLTLLQTGVAAWMVLDRAGTQETFGGGLNTALFLLAGLSVLFASYVGFRRKLAPLRAGMGWFVGALLVVSCLSLAIVDYSALGGSGPLVPVVLVVTIIVGYMRARSR